MPKMINFASAMNRLWQMLVWMRRWNHCRGFGIQSPTDYRFVRYVINESWPYYAYATLHPQDHWLSRKLGQLYLRLANELQPHTVVDAVGVSDYLHAGCRGASIVERPEDFDLAIVPVQYDYRPLLSHAHDGSMLVVQDIYNDRSRWKQIQADSRFTVTFDLYYCGIAVIDQRRSPNNYIVNF